MVTVNSGVLSISNTSGSSGQSIGVHSIKTFPVGMALSVRSVAVSGQHTALIGFGSSPFRPYPHGGTSPGCTWYARSGNLTSTMSWRSENGVTGTYDSATEDLTNYQIFKMIRTSSSTVEFYRNNVLEYTATGLVLTAEYPIYFSNDGHTKPNISYIDFMAVA